jgi:pyridoxal phosphate enzyme (YggS family)
VTDSRRAELAAGLARVRERIAGACAAAGRDPGEITLVAVTKTYPASDVVLLAELGVRDIGENRDQDAAGKAAEVAAAGVDVRWHFVGQLQRNKCASIVRYADLVHSVDSIRLAAALGTAAERHRERPLDVLVQVSIDGDPHRGGVPAEALDPVAEAVAESTALQLRGVMAIAPLSWSPDVAFARLADVAHQLTVGYPTAKLISAGMSDDLEAAIRYGATHVRVGTALLGVRPPHGVA